MRIFGFAKKKCSENGSQAPEKFFCFFAFGSIGNLILFIDVFKEVNTF